MHTFRRFDLWLCLAALLLGGCIDSKSPLSDPKTPEVDDRLLGIWRAPADKSDVLEIYHVGRATDGPPGMYRIIGVSHRKAGLDVMEMLGFVTKIGDKTYLNVTGGDREAMQALHDKDWNTIGKGGYFLFRYEVDGDTLAIRSVDSDAKREAIEGGKIKGEVSAQTAVFADSSENLAHFFATAGDSLFTKEPGRLERVTLK